MRWTAENRAISVFDSQPYYADLNDEQTPFIPASFIALNLCFVKVLLATKRGLGNLYGVKPVCPCETSKLWKKRREIHEKRSFVSGRRADPNHYLTEYI